MAKVSIADISRLLDPGDSDNHLARVSDDPLGHCFILNFKATYIQVSKQIQVHPSLAKWFVSISCHAVEAYIIITGLSFSLLGQMKAWRRL